MKKTFKDYLRQDISNVFINLGEFGEEANINGKISTVVIDDEALEKQNLSKGEKLTKGELLFYVEKSIFEHIPQPDKLMDFNGKRYRIIDVSDQIGILSITLTRYQG